MSSPADEGGERPPRDELLAALDRAVRLAGAQGVFYGRLVADRVGLGTTDFECLDFLNVWGAMTAGQLAERSGLTTGAITGVVDRLERAGYVRRERDPNDRRRVFVALNGTKAIEEIGPYYAEPGARMAEIMARYGDEDLATLLDFTTRGYEVFRDATARLQTSRESRVESREEC